MCKSKPQDFISHPRGWLSSKKYWTITSASEDIEKLEHTCTVNRDVKWCSHLENGVAIPQTVKHRVKL